MSDDELAFAGPGALGTRVRSGELAPRELVELFLARIEALDPRLNAFRLTIADEALAAADALADSDLAGAGPLAGVPVAIKDDLPVAGQTVNLGLAASGPSRTSTRSRSRVCERRVRSRSGSPTSPS